MSPQLRLACCLYFLSSLSSLPSRTLYIFNYQYIRSGHLDLSLIHLSIIVCYSFRNRYQLKRQTAACWCLKACISDFTQINLAIHGYMEGRWTNQQARTGPVRPPRPSHSLDYVGPSPRVTPRPSNDLTSTSKSRISTTNSRGGSRLQEQLSPGSNDTSFRWSGADSSTGSERKRTFKKAVRKLFGRRSKEEPAQQPAPRSVPPGHGYHRSVRQPEKQMKDEGFALTRRRIPANSLDHLHLRFSPYDRTHHHLCRHGSFLFHLNCPSPLFCEYALRTPSNSPRAHNSSHWT